MANFPKVSVQGLSQNYEICSFHHLFRYNTPKNVFGNVLNRKLAFLDYKNMDLNKSQNWNFSKGVIPWFRPKLSNFLSSFFQVRYGKKKCFVRFYIENQHFQVIKTWMKKSRKMANFPKGSVHGFSQKYEICLFLLFR